MNEIFKGMPGSPITYLASDISAGQTTISVADDTALPDAPNICTIGYGEEIETIKYGTKSSGVLQNVVRGIEGAPRSWQSGTEVARFFTAYDHDAIAEVLLPGAVIVESGSNERGRYVKYGDGTMICTHDFSVGGITMTQHTSSGLYYALLSAMTFPAPFINTPYVRVDVHAQEYIGSGNRSLVETKFHPRIYAISDISTIPRVGRYFAIGQWK